MNNNDDALDARLHAADPALTRTGSHETDLATATTRTGGALRDWWATSTARSRRSVAVGSALSVVVASVSVGALVTPRGPLFELAGGQQTALSANADDAGRMASSSKMMMPYVDYQYAAGDGLSTVGGSGSVFELALTGDPLAELSSIADYFGLDGKPTESQYFDANWPTYVIGPEDGSAENLTLSWSGTGMWWYSNPAAYPVPECLSERTVGKGDDAYTECVTYEETPSGLNPDEADTRARAEQFFAATGLTISADDIVVYVDEWSSTATGALHVDGQPTAIEWSISWSNNGELAWAQGNVASAVNRGSFPTVSEAAAADRANDWRWFGSGPSEYAGAWMAYASDGALVKSGEATVGPQTSDQSTVETEPSEESTSEPTIETTAEPSEESTSEPDVEPTVEPSPEPSDDSTSEPVVEPTDEPDVEPAPDEIPVEEVVLTESEAALLLVWDAAGTAWLVPGYELRWDDGWWLGIVAVADGVIAMPEYDGIEPMPID